MCLASDHCQQNIYSTSVAAWQMHVAFVWQVWARTAVWKACGRFSGPWGRHFHAVHFAHLPDRLWHISWWQSQIQASCVKQGQLSFDQWRDHLLWYAANTCSGVLSLCNCGKHASPALNALRIKQSCRINHACNITSKPFQHNLMHGCLMSHTLFFYEKEMMLF